MITATYDDRVSRVTITASGLEPGASVYLDRSSDGVRWTPVRGYWTGDAITVDAAGGFPLPAHDYEFAPDVENIYRAWVYVDSDGDGSWESMTQETTTITPDLGGRPWLKIISRPFLNRPVTVYDYGEVVRPSRAGVFDVLGATLPVVVSDVRGSQRFELQLVTETATQRRDLEIALAGGETVLLQVPATADVPAGYFHVGEVTTARPSRYSVRRILTLPVIETTAPAASIVGVVSTWQTVLNNEASWNDVLAGYATWLELVERIADAEDVITE